MEVLLLLLLSSSALAADVLYCDRVYQLHDRYANTSAKNGHVNTLGLTSLRPPVCGALDSERSKSFLAISRRAMKEPSRRDCCAARSVCLTMSGALLGPRYAHL